MNSKLALEQKTKTKLDAFVANPTHALLLFGSDGIGKRAVAMELIAYILGTTTPESHPYIKIVQPQKGTISIESVRELQKFTQLKTVGARHFRRAILVEGAQGLTTEAQNAFLKLLEEPPADTIIILTCSDKQKLLPTILSRAQHLTIALPNEEVVKKFFAAQAPASDVTQAYYLAGGLPGLMSSLLSDQNHPLANATKEAKAILALPTFDRLCKAESLAKDKEQCRLVLQSLAGIARICIAQAAKTNNHAKIKQWHKILAASARAIDALDKNANVKLLTTNLLLSL